jgi:adenylate cyclase
MSQSRRLAAILAADVAGYSRLIGADEQGTLARLKAIRSELIDPQIAAHHGGSSRRPATVCWSNSAAPSMRCAAPVMCRRTWSSAMRRPFRHRLALCAGAITVQHSTD